MVMFAHGDLSQQLPELEAIHYFPLSPAVEIPPPHRVPDQILSVWKLHLSLNAMFFRHNV